MTTVGTLAGISADPCGGGDLHRAGPILLAATNSLEDRSSVAGFPATLFGCRNSYIQDYLRLGVTKSFLEELSLDMVIPISKLVAMPPVKRDFSHHSRRNPRRDPETDIPVSLKALLQRV
jgi:hypothetical protein